MEDRKGIDWNEDETTICLGLYYLYSSGVVSFEEGVKAVSLLLGRSRGSVGYKLGNLKSCDTPGTGFANKSKTDNLIFDRFVGNVDKLFVEIKAILAKPIYKEEDSSILLIRNPYGDSTITGDALRDSGEEYVFGDGQETENFSSEDKESLVRTRAKQWAFRTSLLTNYDKTCCVSGIKLPQLLVASHIVPWAKDKSKRLDPANGLLLNSMLDRAFDQGLITFHPEKHNLIISDKIRDEKTLDYLSQYKDCILTPPRHQRATPSKENLQYHNDLIFNHFVEERDGFQCILYPDA